MEREEVYYIQKINWISQRKIQSLRNQKRNYYERPKEMQELLKLATEENIRYTNLDIIEKERKKDVPKLKLIESSIIARRQLNQKIDVIHSFQIMPQNISDDQNQFKSLLKRSKYVLEVSKEALQKKTLHQIDFQNKQEKAKTVFKDYNRFKMLTNEYFVWIIFIIAFSLFKIVSNITYSQQVGRFLIFINKIISK